MNRIWTTPEHATLEGRFVVLRPLDIERDATALHEISHGDAAREIIWKFLPRGPFENLAALKTWLTKDMSNGRDPLAFTVFSRDENAPVGMVALLSIEVEQGRAEIGHVWFSPRVHRTKINTETQFLLLRHLFDEKNYRRVEWKCDAKNAASRAAAARLGFTYEGRFRQHMMLHGENRDTDWFSMIDKDWPLRKSNFERWLYSGETLSLDALNNG